VYHVATGTWTRGAATGAFGPDVLYNNNANTGYFTTMPDQTVTGFEITDQGRMPTTVSSGNSDLYTIDGLQLAYCTNQGNALTVNYTFYETYSPCGAFGTGTNPNSVSVTGLPPAQVVGAQTCWIVTVDLVGTGDEFTIKGDGADDIWNQDPALDSFGYAFHYTGHGLDTTTGPLLCGDPNNAPMGAGTKPSWGFGAGPLGTGLDTQDQFWIETLTLAGPGCYWFGGYPANPYAAMWLQLYGDKASGSIGTPYCAPGNANSVSPGGAVLTGTGGFGSAAATFTITNTPATQNGILYAGPNQPNLPFGCGNRCVGGTTIRGPVTNPGASTTLNTSFDMSPANAVNIQWWYRDPANFMACGNVFNLSNALQP
jgi:hypothetical protein